jgi:hypothetical protein
MKNVVFWDVTLCKSCVKRRFGGTNRLHLQGRKIRKRGTSVSRWLDGGDTFFRNEAEWTPFQTPYFSENFVGPGIKHGTSGSVARNPDH